MRQLKQLIPVENGPLRNQGVSGGILHTSLPVIGFRMRGSHVGLMAVCNTEQLHDTNAKNDVKINPKINLSDFEKISVNVLEIELFCT